MSKQALLDFLDKHQLKYQQFEHEPIFTVEQGLHLQKIIPGAHSKNLFLKDKKNHFFLVSILEHKRLDLKQFAKIYGKGGFSFASSQALYKKLKLQPGSVTPFGLLHETAKDVTFILDKEFLNFDFVNFHPLTNEATISMPLQSFLKFFDHVGNKPEIIFLPELLDK